MSPEGDRAGFDAAAGLRRRAAELIFVLQFATRLPVPDAGAATAASPALAQAIWALPLAGAVVGAGGAAASALAFALGVPPAICAVLALAATLLLTGALHEDGLADTADGFGGGRTRERKLDIMRDSRIGSYGVCAVVLSLMLRGGALAALAAPGPVAWALIAAHMAARAPLPAFMRMLPPARSDGLGAGAGTPALGCAVWAAAIGAFTLGLCLGPVKAAVALGLLVVLVLLMRWLALRQIGGHTGDVLGALEQIGEILVLIVACAR